MAIGKNHKEAEIIIPVTGIKHPEVIDGVQADGANSIPIRK
jgi:hypothetical protein